MVASSITQQHFSIVLPVICIIYIQLRMTGFKIQSIWIMLICQQSFINSESKTQADWGPGSGHIGPFTRIVSVHHSAAKVNADISIFRSLILTCWCLASIILVFVRNAFVKKKWYGWQDCVLGPRLPSVCKCGTADSMHIYALLCTWSC